MKRFYLFLAAAFCIATISVTASGQTAGDYRSKTSGDWNVTGTWEIFNGVTWIDAVATPTDLTAGVTTIRNTHTVTVTAAVTVDQVVVDSGGQITLNSGVTLTIANGSGTDLSVTGIFNNAGTVTINASATVEFNSGGKYQHNFTTTQGTIPAATWDINSTVEIIGYTSSGLTIGASNGFNQSFGHFTWNCASQTANIQLAGNLTTVNGNFNFTTSNTGDVNLASSQSPTLTIGGNMTVSAGSLQFATTTSSTTVAVAGNYSQSGGTVNMAPSGMTSGTEILQVAGNFSITGTGVIRKTDADPTGKVVFNKSSGTQTFSSTSGGINTHVISIDVGTGSTTNTLTLNSNLAMSTSATATLTVLSGSTLDTGTNIVIGNTFTLNSGGTLKIGSTAGISSSGATGNIQTTTRSFSTGGNYNYNGTTAQVTGSGLPATVDVLTDSNTSAVVTLQSNTSATSLSLPSGANLKINDDITLTLTGNSILSGTVSGGNANSTLLFAGSTLTNSGTISVAQTTFNNSGAVQQNLAGTGAWTGTTLTLSGGGTKSLSNSITFAVGTILISSSTTLAIGTNTLTFNGSTFTNNGAFTSGAGGEVVFSGTVAQTINGTASTPFADLTIANTGGGSTNMTTSCSASGLLTLTSDLTVTHPASLTQSGTSTGAGDVVGGVRRIDVNGTAKSFGNENVQIANSGATEVRVFLVKGSAPTNFPGAVLRIYTITPGAGAVSATVRLRYIDPGELNGNVEGSLTLWRATGSPNATWQDQGFTTRSTASDWVEKTGVTGFSSWVLADGSAGHAPTAVRLTQFNAASFADGVQLSWESGFEVNNLGYHLYRELNGRRSRVTPSVIAGSALTVGPGRSMTAGYSYSWFDPQGTPNTAYQLEAIDVDGTSQLAGPVYPYGGSRGAKSSRRSRAMLLNEIEANSSDNIEITSWPAAKQAAEESALTVSQKSFGIQQAIASGKAIKIHVRQNGWHRVTQTELAAAGLDSATDARLLQLYVDGNEVPISLSSEGARLNVGDSIEFYGVPLDTPTTDTRVYWLIEGNTPGKRMIARRKIKFSDNSEPAPGSFDLTIQRRDKLIYSAGILNGDADNMFGSPVRPNPVNQTLSLKNLDPQSVSQRQVEVALQGLTEGNHQVQLKVNGATIGTMTFTGREHSVSKFPVSPELLSEGDNVVTLGSMNGQADISLIDWIRITYPHQYKADNDTLKLSVNGGEVVRIDGFSNPNIRVVDVTEPNSPAQLSSIATRSGNTYSTKIQTIGSGARTLIAFTENLMSHPAAVSANQPSALSATTNSADMVIISHKDFKQAIEPLAALRRSQGLDVAVVDVEDVYDEFSHGAHTPAALKSFLMFAATWWSRAPKYLLLVGDSSADPRNYLNRGENDLVPTKLIDTSSLETGSDDWLVDFSNTGLPDMSVGRLPGRTVADINLMVSKIISYEHERESNAPLRGAVMVADRGFEVQSAQTQSILSSSVTVQTINRAEVGSDDIMRGQLVNALNQGPTIVNYYGHGSLRVWTGANLLNTDMAGGLTNANRLSLYVMMTCLNGYSSDPSVESLGEASLKAPHGGAVAVWASSGFTTPQPQFEMNTEFYRLLFGSHPMRLGEAIRKAKAATADMDVRRTWVLLGDPAMRIR